MRKMITLVPLLSLVVLASCRSVDSATFASYPARPADADVRVFRTQQPACAFDEVGLVTWSPMTGFESLEDGLVAMKRRAREMGGDAIVGFSYGQRSTGVSTTISSDSTGATSTSSIDTEDIATGTVVRYREPGCV